VIELLYDCLNRVSTKRAWDPNSALVYTITYEYDLMGRVYRTNKTVGETTDTTKNTYDRAGRLIRVEYPGGKTVSYQYDAAGNRTRLTYPDNTYITYDYDELNRMKAVKDSASTLASYTYDTRSRRTRLDYVNDAYATYSYDAASRLTTLDNQMQNGQHIYGYDYDKVGNRMIMTVTHNNEQPEAHAYVYDAIYQITGVDYPDGFDENLATDTEFNYDAAGNRTSVIDGGGTCTYTTNSLNQYSAAGTTSYQYDNSGNMVHDENYAYGYDPENRLVKVRKSGPYGTLTLGEALDSPLTYTTGGSGNWTTINGGEGHEDLNSAYAPSLAQGQESWLQTTVEGPGTVSFWAKIDPNDAGNDLKFYVDDTQRYNCESEEWEQFSWAVTGAGTHTLKWVYRRNSQSTAGTGYVDDVGWTGSLPAVPPPEPAVTNWRYLTYTYDVSGRRIEKKYDYETITKYVYDGDHCIAEYNAYNQLKRKYIYGPCTDEPICMIDSMTSPAVTSYYHFDALGSVVALTNSSGNTVEVYEYDVYGRVGASDASHPNRIMFIGREYDKETGLYYYRARYYNPQIGRFLQTDPIGYKAGMNLYVYCRNAPLTLIDPMGTQAFPPEFWPGGPFHNPEDPDAKSEWADTTTLLGTLEALLMIVNWVAGTGPTFPNYGDESAMVQLLKTDVRVEKARTMFRAQNSGKPRSEWQPVSFRDTFGLKQYWEYHIKPLHVLGSMKVSITAGVTISPHEGPSGGNTPGWVDGLTVTEPELETITVTNDMSWESAWRFLVYMGTGEKPVGESWERYDFRLFGTVHQEFRWQENVLGR